MAFLWDHQIEAIQKMHNGCILHGNVGSGKSRMGLMYWFSRINNGVRTEDEFKPMTNPIVPLYIITTAQKRDIKDWEKEAVPFFPPEGTIKIDSWNNIKKYVGIRDAFFIFDEQRVVGYGTWAKTFIKIAKNNRWILLSATPGDTWSDYTAVFIANGFYRNKTEFDYEHVIYKIEGKNNYRTVDRYINIGRLVRLRRRILVEAKDQRHTVPHHETITTEYNKEIYRKTVKMRWNPFKDKPIENSSEYCQTLRKIVNISEDKQIKMLELYEKHPKMIIFYNYDYELEILKNLAWGNDVDIAEWNGHKHQPIPKSSKWVYLVQYNAGSEGWNCVWTDTIVFYSDNYSYKMMEQAAGRINRMNTPFTDLYYYHLKSKSSIDRGITEALREKKNFNEGKFYK